MIGVAALMAVMMLVVIRVAVATRRGQRRAVAVSG
jgi:hypothetical protein